MRPFVSGFAPCLSSTGVVVCVRASFLRVGEPGHCVDRAVCLSIPQLTGL